MKNKFNAKWFLKRKVYLNEHEFKLKEWLQIIIHDSLNWKAIIIKIIVFLINAAGITVFLYGKKGNFNLHLIPQTLTWNG